MRAEKMQFKDLGFDVLETGEALQTKGGFLPNGLGDKDFSTSSGFCLSQASL